MLPQKLQHLFEQNEILVLGILIITALALAELAKKLHLPRITGYIAAGIIIGNPVLKLISKQGFEGFQVINLLALGLMSITIGSHLNFHKLKISGKRVLAVFLGESFFAFSLVFLALYFGAAQPILISLLIASISIATAPAATVAVVKETRSKGLLVNTMMPVVAMNNVFCILVFGFFANTLVLKYQGSLDMAILFTRLFREILLALILGLAGGILLKNFSEKNITSGRNILTLVFLTVITITGISETLVINPMFPCMVVGIVISNTSRHRARILTIFEELEYIILIIFFSLAGAHIDVGSLKAAGIMGILYFFARGFGKAAGGSLGAFLCRAPKRIYKYVGASLLPQAGVAIGLVIMASKIEALEPHIDFLTTLVLAVVALNEVFGPPVTKWALSKSGDVDHDRPKLIEFLVEEYVNANLKTADKEDVIHEMIDFFIRSHQATPELKDEITTSVFEREKESSTGIGHGIAIPHGIIDEGPKIWGVIGLSRKGIDFGAADGEPVHLVVLIITPREYRQEIHLAVLSELSRMLSREIVREKLFAAASAAEICDILREQEMGDFNYFID